MRLVIVTNIPAPYRVPIFNILAEKFGADFLVIFYSRREQTRLWDVPDMKFNHIFLTENFRTRACSAGYVTSSISVLRHLKKFSPDVVITTGFTPSNLCAWAYTMLLKRKHISMSDAWIYSEKNLSPLHKLVRKCVLSRAHAFIGASRGSFLLFNSYGISDEAIFRSHLCVDNQKFKTSARFANR